MLEQNNIRELLAAGAVRCTMGARTQLLMTADIEIPATLEWYRKHLPARVRVVYSDPPWNPGNATYWRTHAGRERCASYDHLLDSWLDIVSECVTHGARDVLMEQSVNPKHQALLTAAITRRPNWQLPLLEQWTVYYGSPGSAGCRNPNVLMHFGTRRLSTDPSNMRAEPMTTRACAGLGLLRGDVIVDPCVGKGMSSRQAHYFDCDAIGSELNPKRLLAAITWLQRQGYTVEAL